MIIQEVKDLIRVLIVGAGTLQVPLIKTAKNKGYWVLTADINPRAPGVEYSDAFEPISTVDIEGLKRIAQSHNVDAITTAATDQPLLAIAHAVESCGLKGLSPDVAYKCTRKDKMYRVFLEKGIQCPRSMRISNKRDLKNVQKEFPGSIVMKPVDSSGSQGVSMIATEFNQLLDSFAYAMQNSTCKLAIAQEILSGKEVSVEAVTMNGCTHILQITDKETSGPPHFVEMGHSQPARLSSLDSSLIEKITKRAISAIGIIDGASHTEMIITDEGPSVIEIGARLGGDYITSDLVPLSTGIDMLSIVLDLALGITPRIPLSTQDSAAIRYFHSQPGKLLSIDGLEECQSMDGVVRAEMLVSIGQEIQPLSSSVDRVGYVITKEDNVTNAITIAEKCRAIVKLRTEKGTK